MEQKILTAKPGRQSANIPKEIVNILLVDDQPGKLLAHEAILSELGQRIIKARNGVEALEQLLRNDFAVILLDVNMPNMDGFETAALIRQRPRFERTPIIFVTGYNTTDLDRLKGYELGAVDYMFLPVVPQVLKAKVSVFVELARQTQIIKTQAEDLAANNRNQAQQLEVIQKLNEELREANSELETFSYSVSHDLRAPLRSLTGYIDVLLEDYGSRLDADAHNHLQALDRAAKRMDCLTRDLLAYGRVARETVKLEAVQLQHVIEEVISLIGSQAAKAKITIEPCLAEVLAHRFLLEQCLSNLLSNATKFVPPGVAPEVRIRTEVRANQVRLWVEDNGIGIDPTYHRKIFSIFERVGDMQKYEGTGIGLAIVNRAVQRMGGFCGVESAPGQGSRFWVDLPAPAKPAA
ncbi:MAG TPA: ATP-binding protein [Candidatus Saccharimonadales bacterium]|nr:ATP-binding protein [Candidatus Saccharimonadales bacterium]